MTSVQFELSKRRLHAGSVLFAALSRESNRDRIRRVLNILVAVVGIILTAPLMFLIAAAIRSTSRGPVIFRQTRIGLDRRRNRVPLWPGERNDDLGGKPFTIYKFRTMRHSDVPYREVWATDNDPRVIPVGRLLRRMRLDELPQLFNVLKGDMNIVGPRPEQPQIFQKLRTEVASYELRQKVMPGITGWAQINHHYDTCVDDVRKKVDLDLEYISRRSAAEDLNIMFRTVPVVVGRRGAR